MSIRITALIIVVLFFSFYAWKNWFVSLCACVLLLAVVQHPDFPNSVGGIQGLNPWNFLLLNVVLAWLNRPREEGHYWDMPRGISWMLVGYLFVIIWGDIRLMLNPARPVDYDMGTIISE